MYNFTNGHDSKANNKNSKKTWLEIKQNKRLSSCSDRPVVVPVHGNIDLGKFADDILKEAGINLKGDAR